MSAADVLHGAHLVSEARGLQLLLCAEQQAAGPAGEAQVVAALIAAGNGHLRGHQQLESGYATATVIIGLIQPQQ